MSITWNKAVKHIVRAVKPTHMRLVRSDVLKAAVKQRRGIPSGALPSDLVIARLRLRFRIRTGEVVDPLEMTRLSAAARRYRLGQRKRTRRDAGRRRGAAHRTKIYLWLRRRQWLQSLGR